MLIKARARFLTSANNHVHQRLQSPIKQGGASFLSDISAVFFFFMRQADRGLAVVGERQIGVLTCVVLLSYITINPTHLLPANHFVLLHFVRLWKRKTVIVIDTYVAGHLYSPS